MKRLSARTIVNIAEGIKSKSEPKYVEETTSSKEKALDQAKTYWLLGFTWEEIEAILEDSEEFTEKDINSAVTGAQEYAHEQLKDGPFRSIKQGQLVKLTNGEIGFARDARVDHMDVELLNGNVLKVSSDHIDTVAVKLLTEARNLREAATQMVREAEDPKDLEALGPDPTLELLPKPEEKFEYRTTPQMQTPGGWKDYAPDFTSTEQASEAMQDISEMLMAIKQQKDELNKQVKEIREKLIKERNKEISQLKKEEMEYARELAAIMGKENEAAEEIETVLFRRFEDTLIGFRKIIEPEQLVPGMVDKYNKLIEILQEKVPFYFENIMKTLEEWDKANTFIKENVLTEVALIKPKKTVMSQKTAQGVLSKLKGWLSKFWAWFTESADSITEQTLPQIESIADEMEEFIGEAQVAEKAARLKSALNLYNRK